MDKSLLISHVLRLLPDIKITGTSLRNDPEEFVEQVLPLTKITNAPNSELESLDPSLGISTPSLSPKEVQNQLLEALKTGQRAAEKVEQHHQEADLSPEEMEGLEAIIEVTRPTLRIIEGIFENPPPEWHILNEVRSEIEKMCQSVGRIEIYGHPRLDYAGTGFLIAENVVMTNRHVAEIFCHLDHPFFLFKSGISPHINYLGEAYNPNTIEFALCELIDVHKYYDLALFRVESHMNTGVVPPNPLILASQDTTQYDNRVYIIGYPKWDGETYSLKTISAVLSGPDGTKRLQPGRIRYVHEQNKDIEHDCSTLRGNSGSCLLDLQTHKVLGLHFRGKNYDTNHAIALWMLQSDPLLLKAGIDFA